VCALAAMLEDRGVATTVIGLVRPHMERSGNARGLFVPFPLGRRWAGRATRHSSTACCVPRSACWNGATAPVVLEDFPHDAPGQQPVAGWRPGFVPEPGAPAAVAEWQAAVAAEIAQAQPAWERARARGARSGVGVSFQAPDDWASFAAAFLGDDPPHPPPALGSPALALRFLADDKRAFMAEAAMAEGPVLPPDQWNTWFCRHSMAGRFLVALRAAALDHPHEGFRTVGSRFLVPTPWVPG
jgi:hypothetical protein